MTDKWYRIVKVLGQGYGTMTPEDWEAVPETFRERVEVLELVPDERSATARYQQLVQATGESEWQDKSLRRHKVNGQWQEEVHGQWKDIGRCTVHLDTDDAIYEMPPEIDILADILSRLPPDRARAEIRALDWCLANLAL